MTVMPNFTWPDTVYYQSFISPYMGGKINVVDDLTRVRFSSYNNGAQQNVINMTPFIMAVMMCLFIAH